MHRDLKPGNVLRFEQGGDITWKLADFGVARLDPGVAVQSITDLMTMGLLQPGPRGFRLVDQESGETTLASTWADRLVALIGNDPSAMAGLVLGALLGRTVDSAQWVQCCVAAGVGGRR